MKATDKTVLLALPVLALLAAFWFLLLSPKREEAAQLQTEVQQLEASVAEQEAIALAAEAARKSFPVDYRRVVVLGKAVPEDEDTPSLLVQLNRVAGKTGVDFSAITLAEGGSTATAAQPPPAPITPATAAGESEQQVASVEAGTAPAPATEASVATLPIGAVAGPAGLPVMPYDLNLTGDYFSLSSFIGEVNSLVGLRRDGRPSVFGRLVTIDGFTLTPSDSLSGSGSGLEASFAVTTFITPPEQGLTGGASPAGPAPAQPQAVSTQAESGAPPAAVVSVSGGGSE